MARRGGINTARLSASFILGLIFLVSLFAPILATHDPLATDLSHNLATPSPDHYLGTDLLGRDIFSRLLYGGRQTLSLALGGTLLAMLWGLGLGLLASWHPWLDRLILSLLNVLLAIPALLVALVVVSLLDKSRGSLILALGWAGMSPYARLVRDTLWNLAQRPYVESAVSLGATRTRILLMHLLPNARPTLIAFGGVTFSWAILTGAALTFLGLVSQPDTPDWGVMLAAGRQTVAYAPYEALSAGLLLTLTVWAVNQFME